MTIVSFIFINSLVAIKKCPYCKSMIEEGAEYCSNCGTKLIFPEDEFIEEEIPGDKITEDNMAQEENGGDSLTEEEESASEDANKEETLLELDEAEVSSDWEGEKENIDDSTESEPDEKPASAPPKKGKRRAPLGTDRFGPIPPSSRSWEEDEEAVLDTEIEPGVNDEDEVLDLETDSGAAENEDEVLDLETDSGAGVVEAEDPSFSDEEIEDSEKAETSEPDSDEENMELFPEEPSISPDPTTGEISDSRIVETDEQGDKTETEEKGFRTEDLENMVDPAEKEKEEIERFLDSLKKERQMRREATEEVAEDLPPWAENMKPSSSEGEEEGEIELDESELESLGGQEQEIEIPDEEEVPAKDEYFEGETADEPVLVDTAADVSIGEEKIAQPSLFEEDEEGTLFGGFSKKRRRSSGLSLKLMPRIFDILFVSVLWILSIWGVSYIIKISIFDILNGSIFPLLGFFGILLLIYFFLFYFFLGETLGDYIFSRGR